MLSVQEAGELQTVMNNDKTDSTFTEMERNKEDLLPSAVWVALDFGHIAAPKYFKLTASLPINVSFGGGSVMNNVKSVEIDWEIGTITVDSTSATEVTKLDFIVIE